MEALAEQAAPGTLEGGQFTPTSLALPPGLSYEDWEKMGHTIGRINRSSGWWIGDWVLQGEARYGEMYSQALNSLGLAYQTLLNYVNVCRRVPPPVRREDVSFSHHAVVAALDDPQEQARWLELAATQGWTRGDMRDKMRELGQASARQEAAEPGITGELLPNETELPPDTQVILTPAQQAAQHTTDVRAVAVAVWEAAMQYEHDAEYCVVPVDIMRALGEALGVDGV